MKHWTSTQHKNHNNSECWDVLASQFDIFSQSKQNHTESLQSPPATMHWSYHWSSCSQTVVAMWCNVNEVHQSIPKRVHVGWCWLERSIAETTIRRWFHCDVLSSESWPQCMKWVKVTTLRAEHAKGERLEQWCSYLLYDPQKYTCTGGSTPTRAYLLSDIQTPQTPVNMHNHIDI